MPGESKSNPNHDLDSNTWRDLGRYVREVFIAQDTRRFVLGFTLCGSIMRLWEFDRVGAIASSSFGINLDLLQFIPAILGFLLMNDEQLGFDQLKVRPAVNIGLLRPFGSILKRSVIQIIDKIL